MEIINIEVSNEINLSSSDEGEEETVTKDIFLDIIIKPQPGISDFSPVVNDKLSTSRNEILDGIQSYTDSIYSDYNIDWCIDNENAYNADGCPYSLSSTTLLIPVWSIITIAVGSLIACIICCYIIRCSKRRRADLKNDVNPVSYIESGKLRSKTELQMAVGQQRSTRRSSQAPLPPPRRRTINDRPKSRSRRRTIDSYDNDDRPRLSRVQSNRSSRSQSHRMLQQQDDLPRKQDTDYYLENGESFVFDGVEKVDPPQVLAITNGGDDEVIDDLTERPDPDGDLGIMLGGKWFIDDEDVAPPKR